MLTTAEGKAFVFVVGAPRSGTTWLHRLLAAHPTVAAMEAELTVFTYLSLLNKRYTEEKFHLDQGHWRQGAPLLYSEQEFRDGLRTLALNAYERLLGTKPDATHILDKHPDYALHLPLIAQLFPTCKIIHIIRDGREVVVSMMSAKRRIGFGEGKVQGATRHWVRNILAAREAGHKLGPERYMEVRYEELRAHTAKGLQEIFRFAELPADEALSSQIAAANDIEVRQVSRGDKELNQLRNQRGAIWQNKLNLEERWTMDRMAGHLLRSMGYGQGGWWCVKPGDSLRMALLNAGKRCRNTAGSAWHSLVKPMAERLPG